MPGNGLVAADPVVVVATGVVEEVRLVGDVPGPAEQPAVHRHSQHLVRLGSLSVKPVEGVEDVTVGCCVDGVGRLVARKTLSGLVLTTAGRPPTPEVPGRSSDFPRVTSALLAAPDHRRLAL